MEKLILAHEIQETSDEVKALIVVENGEEHVYEIEDNRRRIGFR